MSRFGDLLADERRTGGVSQHRLALAADTTQRHVSFLETGRSRPTREMILRLSEALKLQPARRADLFEAAGYVSPYKRRSSTDRSVAEAMATVERYILCNWPYPALAMTPFWDVMAANGRAQEMFGFRADPGPPIGNLFDVLLSPQFRSTIQNWPEVGAIIYSRLRRHALDWPEFAGKLEAAMAGGAFEGVLAPLAETDEIPVILPLAFDLGNGVRFRMTSLEAQFTSAHDDALSGLSIELCLPLDDEGDRFLRGA
ncbi:MAG TPA: helix-turn-helix domain-containing protein [Devosia sp.]